MQGRMDGIGPGATAAAAGATPTPPSFAELTRVFARIGLLSFGGPAGQIALMHREVVEERRWMSESRFLHALNYCMLLPGPEAQQLATYIGWLLHGTRGGVVAGLLFILPGFAVILALSAAYALFQDTHWLETVFYGLKAAVLAIVIDALLRLARRTLKTALARALAAGAFLALFVFQLPFPLVVAAAGLIGFLLSRRDERKGTATLAPPEPDPVPITSAPPTLSHAAKTLAACGLLWLAPFALIAAMLGAGSGAIFTAIGAFFSKMAVVTFGGAYAVLSYVAQQAVEVHGWLKPGEMLDGLALAETTPGPLVLVLAFVGFMGAFRGATGLEPLTAGLLGATLTVWVTFVPCFLWIFLGAPHVEKLRQNVALSGALSAISAAVAGVILNLALWFALHILFARVTRLEAGPVSLPLPELASIDPGAVALTILSAVLLIGLKRGVVTTLAISAAAGIALKLGGLA
ncbi:chromate efflux transporter [Rhizobium sp. RU20A]|uniref:chromate efflux transporter n=1 Tax=Rhizobium sp. RU20A TaxID=1907412 RepID=UPI001FCEBC8A|nr:chromate efflux transporter [Rhizobium sp. RU20A]